MIKAVLVCVACSLAAGVQELTVSTDRGVVRGRTDSSPNLGGVEVNEFLGIPFANPPVGSRRFSRPKTKDFWTGVYNATSKPNACWQPIDTAFGDFFGSTMWNPNTNMSEDCLYLNVWAPKAQINTKLPVMVWIYGGAFYSGSAALDVYDGKQLAARGNVVVVSMNYRVGILGFLRLPNSTDAPGNAGLWDQVEALRWVQRNIDKFGGDKDSVTLFGESAGAASVAYHLISPVSRDLFQRAILQSGSALSNWAFMTPENALLRNAAVFPSLGCGLPGESNNVSDKVLACLRSVKAEDLTHKQWFTTDMVQFPFLPSIDGELLVESPQLSMERGNFKKCPIIVGVNRAEGASYAAYLPEFRSSFQTRKVLHTFDAEEFKRLIANVFKSYPLWPQNARQTDIDSIVCRYRNGDKPEDSEENLSALISAIGDSRFVCSVNSWADYYAAANASVYYYLFDHVSAAKFWGSWTGPMHGDELDYAFGSPFRAPFYSKEDERLSLHMMKLWASFARTGVPTDGSLTDWPLYKTDDTTYYELSAASLKSPKTGRGPRQEFCSFLQQCLSSSTDATTSDPNDLHSCGCQPKTAESKENGASPRSMSVVVCVASAFAALLSWSWHGRFAVLRL